MSKGEIKIPFLKFKKYLKNHNISYQKLYDETGYYPTVICSKINGKMRMSVYDICFFAKTLNIPKEKIFDLFIAEMYEGVKNDRQI